MHEQEALPESRSKAPIDALVRPFQIFARHKAAGAILLLGATLVALVWANSPWRETYFQLLATKVTVGAGSFSLSKPALLWINDGLMGIFFFVIGLELKRELIAGHLATPGRAVLPVAGALGGMVVPALIYVAFNAAGPGAHGWGVPMATDIAFALGILAIASDRVPTSMKVFLAALAIADDLGAILVIALFYTAQVETFALVLGIIVFLVSIVANRAGLRSQVVFLLLGAVVWFAFLKSGVHATLAAVLMAFTIPARTRRDDDEFFGIMQRLLDTVRAGASASPSRLRSATQQNALERMADLIDDSSAPLQRLEHTLMPVVTFLVLPVFALANAGVSLEGNLGAALTSPVSLGVLAGLFLGKQVGILSFSWFAVRMGWATLPQGAGWRHVHAVAVLAGIGFTMALFIAGLGFADPVLHRAAKMGVLLGSLLSGVVGWWLVRRHWRPSGDA